MSWVAYRWVWQLEAALYIGLAPAGALNRCRLYVPARTLWGALTAELARRQTNGFPEYATYGQQLAEDMRLTYLYPAEPEPGSAWSAWLPAYERETGLAWRLEDEALRSRSVGDREMRGRLLASRPGTAIDPATDTAAERSLRETECIGPQWRVDHDGEMKAVGLAGYVFVRVATAIADQITSMRTLFLGGDTRYGLGRVCRVEWRLAAEAFGSRLDLTAEDPDITTHRILAHAELPDSVVTEMYGDREALAGWDHTKAGLERIADVHWKPGSQLDRSCHWSILRTGLWRHQG